MIVIIGHDPDRAVPDLRAGRRPAGAQRRPDHRGRARDLTGFALVFLLLRAFSSGCAALTGVEAISNGVPAFKKPKSRNAATTLLLLGVVAVTMLVGIVALAQLTGLQYVEDPASQIVAGPAGYVQKTVTTQLGETVFGDGSFLLYVVAAATALILFLAANTAFNGFPVLGSILAQDRYLPRQLHTRGDRLAFSNGILFLAAFAIVLIVAFQAEVTRLIQLYIVGVFVSFTLSQAGMLRHWNRLLRTERDPAVRRRMHRSRAINGFGMVLTGAVLVVVLITKFLLGAWIAIAAMAGHLPGDAGHPPALRPVAPELDPADERAGAARRATTPSCWFSKVHQPTLRAVAYAQATRPDTLTALTVNVDEADTRRIQAEWERRDIGGAADRHRLAVPGDHPADHRLREVAAPRRPARRGHRLHPRVRGRPVVGAPAAQPERAADQGPAAVRAGRHGDQRAVAARVELHKDLDRYDEALTAARRAGRAPRPGRRWRRWPAQPARTRRRADGDAGRATRHRRRAGPGDRCRRAMDVEPECRRTAALDGDGRRAGRRRGRPRRALRRPRADGRVVFVRHALPGERVRAVVTEERKGFLRADAVEVLDRLAAPGRAAVPVRRPGPLRRLRLPARRRRPHQRELKAAVVREQLIRLGGLIAAEVDALGVTVRAAACPDEPTAWAGGPGFSTQWTRRAGPGCSSTARTRSCRSTGACIAHPAVRAAAGARPGTGRTWTRSRWSPARPARRPCSAARGRAPPTLVAGPAGSTSGRSVGTGRCPAEAFWQVHPAAADTLAARGGRAARSRAPGERAWDLYGGRRAVRRRARAAPGPATGADHGRGGRDPTAAWRAAQRQPARPDHGHGGARPTWTARWPTRAGGRSTWSCSTRPGPAPGATVVAAIAARSPRAVAYVACDPAALARDVRTFREHGYAADRTAGLRPVPDDPSCGVRGAADRRSRR